MLITGASSGLGRRFAQRLAAEGAAIALAARRLDRLEAVASTIRASGGRATAVQMDVTDPASVHAGYDAAERALGPVTGVIANAGVVGSPQYATDTDPASFAEVLTVNTTGAFLVSREGARRMIAHGSPQTGDGRVLLVGSIRGLVATPRSIGYSASKAAVNMLGMVMARELVGQGVNVNVLCPGYVDTEMLAHIVGTPRGDRLIDGFPRRRLMQAEDLDDLVAFLMSASARAVTGSIFKIDDGQTMA